MSTGNPGPAVTNDVHPQGLTTQQAKRLLFVQKGLSITAAGDTVLPVINSSAWSVQEVVVANATGTATSTTLALWTGAGGTGTNVLTATTMTATTSVVQVVPYGSITSTALSTSPNLYAKLATPGTGTVDLYVFGYDLSSPGLSYNSAQ